MFEPRWAAPAHVGSAFSGRAGGISLAPWNRLNLADHVGDDTLAVAHNRRIFARTMDTAPVWLQQVHGARVVRIGQADVGSASPGVGRSPYPSPNPCLMADAAWTSEPGVACTVLVADCLPVLFALRDGSAVAAAHAGWRGLAAGVLDATLLALQQGMGAEPADVVTWLGPCIGPLQFEVGVDVLQAFGADALANPRFVSRLRRTGEQRWLADLAGLAHDRLRQAGVLHIASAQRCTVSEPSSFFSFRRDGVTGRMAAAVWCRN